LNTLLAIERVQKQFTRRIASISDLAYPERLTSLVSDLEPLEVRRLRMDLDLYYKCLNNILDSPGCEYFCQFQHNSQTRTVVLLIVFKTILIAVYYLTSVPDPDR